MYCGYIMHMWKYVGKVTQGFGTKNEIKQSQVQEERTFLHSNKEGMNLGYPDI